jgi:hypothetical protein
MGTTRNSNIDDLRDRLSKIPKDVLEQVLDGFSRHSYSAHLPAHHSVRAIAGDSCSKTDLLVLSGRDRTDSQGKQN